MGMIIGRLTIPDEAWGAELDGQEYYDDFYPDKNGIEEAEEYLSENGVDVPDEIKELCEHYGKKNNISPELLEAVIWKESRFLQDAQDGTKQCKGLMQVKPSSHQKRMKRLGVSNIFDEAGNIAVGSDYLKELFEEYEDPPVVLALYNGDKRALESGYISAYAKSVLKVAQALEAVKYK